jgi:hypothetical protein
MWSNISEKGGIHFIGLVLLDQYNRDSKNAHADDTVKSDKHGSETGIIKRQNDTLYVIISLFLIRVNPVNPPFPRAAFDFLPKRPSFKRNTPHNDIKANELDSPLSEIHWNFPYLWHFIVSIRTFLDSYGTAHGCKKNVCTGYC